MILKNQCQFDTDFFLEFLLSIQGSNGNGKQRNEFRKY